MGFEIYSGLPWVMEKSGNVFFFKSVKDVPLHFFPKQS